MLKPIIKFILLLLIFSSVKTSAQLRGAITGHVKDSKAQQALIGVNVALVGMQRGVTTDSLGNFRIANLQPGSYHLRFSYIGYKTVVKTDIVVSSASPAVVNVSLSPTAILGETVTVTAGYFSDANLAPVSTTLLAREEIRRFPGGFEDVVRTAATLPGVAVVNEGGRNDLLVRGGGPSENLYLVNGLEVPNINHFGSQGSSSGSLSFVNLDFVENIEFSTGGFGARYGDKMSSVLAVDLRPGRADRLGGKATISATQFGLNLEGPLDRKGSFLISARRSYLDLIFKALGQPFVPVYTDYNLFAKYDLSPTDALSLLALLAIDRIDRDQSTLENRVTNAGILDNEQDQIIAGLKYRKILSGGFLDFALGGTDIAFRFRQVDSTQQAYFRSRASERELSLKIDSYFRLMQASGLAGGLALKRIGNDNTTAFADTIFDRNGRRVARATFDLPGAIAVDTSFYKASAYLEYERNFGKLDLVFGVRGDFFDFLDKSFYPSPRFSATFRLDHKTKIKASLGRYYQSPSQVWITNPANRTLQASQNDMLIAGVNYLLRSDTNLSFEAYFKRYRNLPTGATPGTDYLILTNTGVGYGGREDDFQSFGYIPLVSAGTGAAFGFELLLQKKFSDTPLYGQLSLAYGKSEFTAGNGKTYPGQFDQRFILNLSGGYKFGAKWEISGKFRLFTGAPYTPAYLPAQNGGFVQNLPEEYLVARLDTGHLIDLRIDRRFNFSGWTLILFTDVQNIYNNKLDVRPAYDFWEQKIIDRAELGILPSIGVSAEF